MIKFLNNVIRFRERMYVITFKSLPIDERVGSGLKSKGAFGSSSNFDSAALFAKFILKHCVFHQNYLKLPNLHVY